MERGMFHVTFSFCEPGKEACPEIWEPVQQKRRGRFKTQRSDPALVGRAGAQISKSDFGGREIEFALTHYKSSRS